MSTNALVRASLLTVAVVGVTVWSAHTSTSVHLPFLGLVLGTGLLGFFEPKWGWAWVLLLIALIFIGHIALNLPATDADTAEFATYVSPFPALIGGLLGRLSRNIL